MPPKLSPRTRQLVEKIFGPKRVDEAVQWLEDECGNNLPSCDKADEYEMERIRFAAIKLSAGNIQKLLKAIDEARMDWRPARRDSWRRILVTMSTRMKNGQGRFWRIISLLLNLCVGHVL